MDDVAAGKKQRTKTGFFAGVFGIVTNILAFAAKIAVGAVSGSVGIAADAFNSLTDALSSVLTIVGFRLSAKPADREHPYGHARYEQITALFIAVIMLAAGLMFAKSSVEKIVRPEAPDFGTMTYIALISAIILKLIQAAVNFRLSKKIDSGALRAAALDSRNDVLITSTVLLSVVVTHLFRVNIDGWAGLAVSLFIVASAASTLKSAISPMLGAPPPEQLVQGIDRIVKSRPEILGYHDLIIHNYGSGANFASLHAEVDSSSDLSSVHEVLDWVERQTEAEFGVVLTIHTDPVKVEGKDKDEKTEI